MPQADRAAISSCGASSVTDLESALHVPSVGLEANLSGLARVGLLVSPAPADDKALFFWCRGRE